MVSTRSSYALRGCQLSGGRWGTATVVEAGARYEELTALFRARGVSNPIPEVGVIKVEHALPVTSPAYDLVLSEAESRARWERHHERSSATVSLFRPWLLTLSGPKIVPSAYALLYWAVNLGFSLALIIARFVASHSYA